MLNDNGITKDEYDEALSKKISFERETETPTESLEDGHKPLNVTRTSRPKITKIAASLVKIGKRSKIPRPFT